MSLSCLSLLLNWSFRCSLTREGRCLVAYNWLSVIQNGVYLPVVILGITGTFAQGLSNFLAMIALMWVLGMTLFVTRKALEVPIGTAAGIVVMDLLLGVLIEVLTSRPG